MAKRHTISLLVENKAGVLARVAGLYARRAFNIESLAVGTTEDPAISRITLVVDAKKAPIEQITKQLNKLLNVIAIEELKDETSVQRKLVLVKVSADDSNRSNVLQVISMFRAHVVDVDPNAVTIETTGSEQKVEALLAALDPYGIKEIVQSGTVAIGRGPESMSEQLRHQLSQQRYEYGQSLDDADE
ncbi:MAG: acetolactate synthase small subunit [Actinomycetaceae bacterium]|nr:acetolactate synthase small subunit [Arcanobacterium sp.]MDD7686401.1 acetolactate synthase small subunit [Actinomycetaceae bacterium]MDY5272681.1 acetolactate synthase small subunit [Arcanobacterium sp.]